MALRTAKKQLKGFTLVELMVVLVILGIVSVGAITAITSQSKVYHSEEDLIDMQMNGRIAMERISFLLRMAGVNCSGSFGNMLDKGSLTIDGSSTSTNNHPVTGGKNPLELMFVIGNNAPPTSDQLTLVGAIRYVGRVDPTSIPTNTQIKLICNELPKIDDAVAAKSYIVITPQSENCYRTILTISSTTTKTPTLTLTDSMDIAELNELKATLTAGVFANVYQVQAFTIRLVNNSLRIDDNIAGSSTNLDVADNIQDLQFQYGLDTGSDGQIDSWVDNTTDIDQIRAIRVFILARTGKFDKEYVDRKTYTYPDGTSESFEGNDNFTDLNTSEHVHRYIFESTITVRNRNF